MIDVRTITNLHAETVKQWHEEGIDNRYQGFLNLVCREHQQNFRLWHEEDMARETNAADAELEAVKRRTDKLNQRRNELIEQLDRAVVDQIQQESDAPLPSSDPNAETPGRIIDRLSSLSVRIFHLREQADRQDADERRQREVESSLETLYEQLNDLSTSLAERVPSLFAGVIRPHLHRETRAGNDLARISRRHKSKKAA
ncbi:MAG: DUF4254 domain-containing protein [Pirellulaceae bacterium]|nr:DUF4254 domain-containing protein [Pirellulaceae bacterium]